MDAKELRIGNYIVKNQTGRIDRVFRITPAHLNDLAHIDYDPIPLTPEWLERLGATPFKSYVLDREDWSLYVGEYESSRIMYGDGFVYCEVPDANMWCPFNIRQLNYVHQLQNLYFALTGEELTIKQPETK
jgi:hypothetical protein